MASVREWLPGVGRTGDHSEGPRTSQSVCGRRHAGDIKVGPVTGVEIYVTILESASAIALSRSAAAC